MATGQGDSHMKPIMSQGDLLKYQDAFNCHAKAGKIKGSDMYDISRKLGYRLTKDLLDGILADNELGPSSDIGFPQFMKLIMENKVEITVEEHRLADIREKFQRYDLDGNGSISLSEAQWALQAEMDLSPQTALGLLNQFVQLNYDQFANFYRNIQRKKIEIYEKFGKYDKNMDGMISKDEAYLILNQELGFSKDKSDALVKRFDVNKDGLVSYLEFAEFYIAIEERKRKIRLSFSKFDTAGDGYVSVEQAEEVLQKCLGFSDDKCKTTVEHYDKNNDGKIHYEEFLEFYTMMEEERQKLLVEFHRYDADGDGKISYKEFHRMLSQKGQADKEITNLMTGYDQDHDGFLDFEEFKKFLNFQ